MLARSRIMRTSKKAMGYAGVVQVTTGKAGKMRLRGKEAAMTNEQINIAIAESLGWRKITQFSQYPKSWGGKPARYDTPVWRLTLRHDLEEDECHKYGWKGNKGDVIYDGPNYTSDLNACHEFEKKLSLKDRNVYTSWLYESSLNLGLATWESAHATARQRCEAYLKTIGKWIE